MTAVPVQFPIAVLHSLYDYNPSVVLFSVAHAHFIKCSVSHPKDSQHHNSVNKFVNPSLLVRVEKISQNISVSSHVRLCDIGQIFGMLLSLL
jgi:hypothetical protein